MKIHFLFTFFSSHMHEIMKLTQISLNFTKSSCFLFHSGTHSVPSGAYMYIFPWDFQK